MKSDGGLAYCMVFVAAIKHLVLCFYSGSCHLNGAGLMEWARVGKGNVQVFKILPDPFRGVLLGCNISPQFVCILSINTHACVQVRHTALKMMKCFERSCFSQHREGFDGGRRAVPKNNL